MRRLLAALLLVVPTCVWAGNQERESLSALARNRLAALAGERAPPRLLFRKAEDGQRWLAEMSRRLEKRMPDRRIRYEFLRTLHFEAKNNGLNPQLILAVIEVESGFRKYAISVASARGYMQVMPFWTAEAGRPRDNLFHLRTNLVYGCFILGLYLDRENNDLFRALGRYNGSLGKADYPNLVFAALKNRWAYDGPTD